METENAVLAFWFSFITYTSAMAGLVMTCKQLVTSLTREVFGYVVEVITASALTWMTIKILIFWINLAACCFSQTI